MEAPHVGGTEEEGDQTMEADYRQTEETDMEECDARFMSYYKITVQWIFWPRQNNDNM